MDALTHYHLSEEYAAKAGRFLEHMRRSDIDDMRLAFAEISASAQLAQAHATLALAGVTALAGDLPGDDYEMWRETVAVTAPIPAETDDEPEDDEPGCEVVTEDGDDAA